MVKGMLETAVHGRWGYCDMGVVHKFKEGSLVVGGGVEIGWVVVSLVVENDNVPLELELGIGSVG